MSLIPAKGYSLAPLIPLISLTGLADVLLIATKRLGPLEPSDRRGPGVSYASRGQSKLSADDDEVPSPDDV
jgi:hypothetical protein